MDAKEIRFRLVQKLSNVREQCELAVRGKHRRQPRWWSQWDPALTCDNNLRNAIEQGDSPRAAERLTAYLTERNSAQFFWPLADRSAIVTAFTSYFPQRAEKIVQEAEALCAHRFRIFAYPEIACGLRIPWRRDLIHGIESGLRHYSRYPVLVMDKVGDTKIVWELNRHQHFSTLCLAHLLTGEEKFAEECLAQWEDWMEQNPYLRGINWASTLEVAFRC
ncbi:MAG: heparinase II/III family protein, partial [Candidatus Acidiferrum sp.]